MKTLRYGSKGADVKKLQKALNNDFDEVLKVDGIFGSGTKHALIRAQREKRISADGIFGPQTARTFKMESVNINTKTVNIEKSVNVKRLSTSALKEIYGNPFKKGLTLSNKFSAQMTMIDTPEWFPGGKIYCHKIMAECLEIWFKLIEKHKLTDLILTYDGCYNARNVRGGNSFSRHAVGMAIDINAKWNGLNKKSADGFGTVKPLVDLAEEAGLFWGGNFSREDGMHFEVGIPVEIPKEIEEKG